MFRGKESSNRIKISRLVQELLNFGVFGSLWLWGWGRWVGGIWGHEGCHHMHAHACKCMYRNCKWLPTWRHPCLSCLTCMCMRACMCMCMHACVHGTPPTHLYPPPPPSTHPPPPRGRTLRISQNSITKSVENSPSMGGCMIYWAGGWVDGWDQVKSLKFNKC